MWYMQQTPELQDDALTEEDLEDLEEMLKLLKPFKKVTMLGQQKGTTCGSIASALWCYDYLLAQLESWEGQTRRGANRGETGFRAAVNLLWTLLKKYYKETDKSPVYVAAMALDPRHKMVYFERQWSSEWVAAAKNQMRRLYNEYRIGEEDADTLEHAKNHAPSARPKGGKKTSLWGTENLDISMFLYGETTITAMDELEAYLSEPVLRFGSNAERENLNLESWWRSNSTVYPTLARMYWDICAIPSMSAEPERVFSGFTLRMVEY
jgi:hypothetical protein